MAAPPASATAPWPAAKSSAMGLSEVAVVMISKGAPKENRAKVKEHGPPFPVVLQQQWEISRRHAMLATPVAYIIDEAGVIALLLQHNREGQSMLFDLRAIFLRL